MNVIEYGKQNTDIIMLLHGGGLSWWNYKAEAELLHEMLPGSRLEIKDGLYHGEYSINQPEIYVEELLKMIVK